MTESRMTVDLDIPVTAEGREQRRLAAWDAWYSTLPDDLRRRLSIHDFKRLGDCFKQAFNIQDIRPPAGFDWNVLATLRKRESGLY